MYCMIFIFNTIILQVLYLTTLAGRWYSIEVTGRPEHVLLAMGKKKGHCILSEECTSY